VRGEAAKCHSARENSRNRHEEGGTDKKFAVAEMPNKIEVNGMAELVGERVKRR